MICCSGGDEGDGQFEWRVFISYPKKLFGKRPAGSEGDPLLQQVRQVLEEASIRTQVEDDG
jgi:hypothetical protein